MSAEESAQAATQSQSLDYDKRMQTCRKVWRSDYARILTHARATKDLSRYNTC